MSSQIPYLDLNQCLLLSHSIGKDQMNSALLNPIFYLCFPCFYNCKYYIECTLISCQLILQIHVYLIIRVLSPCESLIIFYFLLFSFFANLMSTVYRNCHRLFYSYCYSTIYRVPVANKSVFVGLMYFDFSFLRKQRKSVTSSQQQIRR